MSGVVLLILLVLVISMMIAVARTHNYAQETADKVEKILKILSEKKD